MQTTHRQRSSTCSGPSFWARSPLQSSPSSQSTTRFLTILWRSLASGGSTVRIYQAVLMSDDSLNEGYFISLPKEQRRRTATTIRQDMADPIGRAAITFMAFAHYAALCEKQGGREVYHDWDDRARRCASFAKQAVETQASQSLEQRVRSIGPLLDLRTAHVRV